MSNTVFDVLTFGSITIDIFIPLNKELPIKLMEEDPDDCHLKIPLGEKIRVQDSLVQCGGGSANTAIGFSKLGFDCAAFGVMGDQSYKAFLMQELEKNNINTDYVTFAKNENSSFSVILNAWNGERTVLHHRTVCDNFSGKMLLEAPETRSVYIGHLCVSHFLGNLPEWKRIYPERKIFWNPGKTQFQKGFKYFKDILPTIDCLFINREEAEMFTELKGKTISKKEATEKIIGTEVLPFKPHRSSSLSDVRNIAKKLLGAGVKQVIITDGSRGAQLFTKDVHLFVPSQEVEVLDTLGAGDAFAVGVSAAILYEKDPKEQLVWGSFNAGSVIQKLGAQPGQISLAEMKLLVN